MKEKIKFRIDEDNGHLLVSYNNGCTWEDLGRVKGEDGHDGSGGINGQNGVNGSNGVDGQNGVDGKTPLIRINNNRWQVSYDNGLNWENLNNLPANATSFVVDPVIREDAERPEPYISHTTQGNTVTLHFFNLKGLQGEQGADGTPGTKVNFDFKQNEVDCLEINDAYVDANGHLQVLVSLDPRTFKDCGPFKGDTGEQGIQGIQGIQGEQGEKGCKIFFIDTYNDGFFVEGARVDDILVYTGAPVEGIAAVGDVFECVAIDGQSNQTWSYKLSVKGPKGDDASIITPSFRMVENPQEGSSQIQVSLDGGATWSAIGNVPSKGIVSVSDASRIEGQHIYRILFTDGTVYDMVVYDGTGGEGGGGGITLALNIKADAASCTAVGDAYIDQDVSHTTTYGHLMVLTALPSTFTDGGPIQGPQGVPGLSVAALTNYIESNATWAQLCYRPGLIPWTLNTTSNQTVRLAADGTVKSGDIIILYGEDTDNHNRWLCFCMCMDTTPTTSGNIRVQELGGMMLLRGADGSNGTNGTSAHWFTGNLVEGSGTVTAAVPGAVVGDMYLNTDNTSGSFCRVYQSQGSDQWTEVCSIRGAAGTNGTNGTNGINGTSSYWYTGTAVSGTGSNISAAITGSKAGDMYLNTNTCYVYIATAPNTWSWVCSIKGMPGTDGEDGLGISDIQWTSNSAGQPRNTPGTTDTYTIYSSRATTMGTFTVYNGLNGTNGTNGTNGRDGRDGRDGVDGTVVNKAYRFVSTQNSSYLSFGNIDIAVNILYADARLTFNIEDSYNPYADVHLTFYLEANEINWPECMSAIDAYEQGSSVVGTVEGAFIPESQADRISLPSQERNQFYATLNIRHTSGWQGKETEAKACMVLDMHGVLPVSDPTDLEKEYVDTFVDDSVFEFAFL